MPILKVKDGDSWKCVFGGGNKSTVNETESTEYSGCYYRMVDGVQQWINPPMIVNTSYTTVERYNGQPVKVALFEVDVESANSALDISTVVPSDAIIIDFIGTASGTSPNFATTYHTFYPAMSLYGGPSSHFDVNFEDGWLYVSNNSELENFKTRVILKFI